MPVAVMSGPSLHQVDTSGKRTDWRTAGDAADHIEQRRVVHDQQQQSEDAVRVHALFLRESLVLAIVKMRVTHRLPDLFEQIRIKKARQPYGVRRIERSAHRLQGLGRLRAD